MRLDEIDDAQVSSTDAIAIERREAIRFIGLLDSLIEDAAFTFAYETIAGIKATVETSHRVTEGQRRAIANIRLGQERAQSASEDRNSGNRFRAWDRWRRD